MKFFLAFYIVLVFLYSAWSEACSLPQRQSRFSQINFEGCSTKPENEFVLFEGHVDLMEGDFYFFDKKSSEVFILHTSCYEYFSDTDLDTDFPLDISFYGASVGRDFTRGFPVVYIFELKKSSRPLRNF